MQLSAMNGLWLAPKEARSASVAAASCPDPEVSCHQGMGAAIAAAGRSHVCCQPGLVASWQLWRHVRSAAAAAPVAGAGVGWRPKLVEGCRLTAALLQPQKTRRCADVVGAGVLLWLQQLADVYLVCCPQLSCGADAGSHGANAAGAAAIAASIPEVAKAEPPVPGWPTAAIL